MIRNPLILTLIHGVRPSTVVHIGGHHGQDHNAYVKMGAKQIIWGEASAINASVISQRYPKDIVVNKIFWDNDNQTLPFFDNGDSRVSSAKKFAVLKDSEISSIGVETITLDSVMTRFNPKGRILLVLDVQGAELEVLNGARNSVPKFQYVVLEIIHGSDMYIGSAPETMLVERMKEYGFYPSARRLSHDLKYSDVLFTKRKHLNKFSMLLDEMVNGLMFIRHLIRFRHRLTQRWHCSICGK